MAKPKKVNGVSGTTYRRKHGFSRQRLHTLKKKGRIKYTEDGKIDEAATDAATAAARNKAQQALRNPSRQVKEYYDALAARLDYEQKAGKLCEVEKVKKEAFQMGRTVRNAILNVPKRLAGPLAAETDPRKCELLLMNELTEALKALAT